MRFPGPVGPVSPADPDGPAPPAGPVGPIPNGPVAPVDPVGPPGAPVGPPTITTGFDMIGAEICTMSRPYDRNRNPDTVDECLRIPPSHGIATTYIIPIDKNRSGILFDVILGTGLYVIRSERQSDVVD